MANDDPHDHAPVPSLLPSEADNQTLTKPLLTNTQNEAVAKDIGHRAMSNLELYLKEDGPVLLAEAIQLFREVATLQPPGHPDRAVSLNNLARAIHAHYQRYGQGSDLAEVIKLNKEALALRCSGHPSRSVSLGNLASALLARYQRDGTESDMAEAIELNREALSLRPPDHSDRSISLNNLATGILARYQQDGGEFDLVEAIELNREALTLQPAGHPNRSETLSILANAVLAWYQRGGEGSDLVEVIALNREALTLRPLGHHNHSISLNNLAAAILTQYQRDGGESDLAEAIKLNREALALRSPGHPNRSESLNNLANVVLIKYERDGRGSDLVEVIEFHKDALTLRPRGHPHRWQTLNNLALALFMRYQQYGEGSDLMEVIELQRETLTLLGPGQPNRSISLNNLATTILTRYQREGGGSDLVEVIELNKEALTLRLPGHPNRSESLNNLANAILTRYERDGGGLDLVDVIELYREALNLRPFGHPHRWQPLSNLAFAILMRYQRNGAGSDLEESIELNREALTLFPSGHPHLSVSLNNLATTVLTRYQRDGEGSDLVEVIALNREALTLRPPGHPNRSESLNNLANAIFTRYLRDGRSDLVEVIEFHTEAIALRRPGHPHRWQTLTNLAVVFRLKFLKTWIMSDIFTARKYQKEALVTLSKNHPCWSVTASTLAADLVRSSQHLEPSAVDEIIQLLRTAVAAKTSPIPDRLQAAMRWIDIATGIDRKSVLEAYWSALTHLGGALALGRSLQDRHSSLVSEGTYQGLALNAALWSLGGDSTDPKLAVELLDQGRNVLLASVGQLRVDLSDIRQVDPSLAEEFYRASRLLELAVLKRQEIPGGELSHQDPASRYTRVSGEWEAVVAKIRLLPGCESFLLPVPYTKLREAAIGGPVIVILIGKEGSTAIIVTTSEEPHVVHLPNATEEALKALHGEMEYALKSLPYPNRATTNMRHILSDIWDTMVQPIVQELQDVLLIPTGSRIWWYPTSWASFLPLHAAGSYKTGGTNIPDLYISSYTPTLQTLRRSRGRFVYSSDRTTSPIIIAQGQTAGQAELACVDNEVGIVLGLAQNAAVLSNEHGTKEGVMRELHNHSWVHLACHGHLDLNDPFQSHFALHDGPLSLQDIVINELPSAEFAYLSACHSAAPDRTLPDEGLTLAGGMQFVGFKSVVGTLWALADEDAPKLAREFYSSLAKRSRSGKGLDCTKTAEALHDAVKKLRDEKVPLYRWVNLVHYGI